MTAKNDTSEVKNRLYRKITSPVFSRFLSLRMLNLTVDLRQRLFAAHGQHRVAEADQQHNQRNAARPSPQQPAERLPIMVHVHG